MSTPQHFQTTLLAAEGLNATGIQVPFSVPEVFGTRGRVAVRGTINGFPYRSSIVPLGGGHMMGVTAAQRAEMGLQAGDTIEVVMRRDEEPRTVTVPDDLAAALAAHPAAQAGWERANYTQRKEMARLLTEAKAPETRARRLAKMLAELGGGE